MKSLIFREDMELNEHDENIKFIENTTSWIKSKNINENYIDHLAYLRMVVDTFVNAEENWKRTLAGRASGLISKMEEQNLKEKDKNNPSRKQSNLFKKYPDQE